MLDICNLICKDSFVFFDGNANKNNVYEKISKQTSILYKINKHQILNSLINKENLNSSYVGNGVVIYDVINDFISESKAIISVLSKGIEHESTDDIPIDIIVLLLVSKTPKSKHIQMLASISRLFRNADLTSKLRGCKNSDSAFVIFSQMLSNKAA